MAMTGIQIFKLLPKTNCKDCGSPTCLAFAMALAAGKAELDACPHVSEEAKAQLAESSAPPIRAVTIGTGDKALKVGGELVLYRHEKTFYNPTGLGVVVSDAMSDDEVSRKVEAADKLEYERVGLGSRRLRFLADQGGRYGRVGLGLGKCEVSWAVFDSKTGRS